MIQKGKLFLAQFTKHQLIILAFFLLGFISFWISYTPVKDEPGTPGLSTESVDTYIPKGYVLVPLEISNLESLNSFIGQAGVVDLYKSKEGQKGTKIGTRIKIIRAPLNPQLFAALVPENKSSELLNYSESLFAVVQNKSESSSEIYSKKTQQKKNIIYQN